MNSSSLAAAGLRIMITATSRAVRRTLDVAGINGYLSE